jgi:hypothetical protein
MIVQFDNVVGALGVDNPLKVSASVIRARLGHGSLSTIQRHLATLRASFLKETELPTEAAVMAFATNPPLDLLESLWHRAAEGAAKALWQTLSHAQEKLGKLEQQYVAQAADIAVFETENDKLDAKNIELQDNLLAAEELLQIVQADSAKAQSMADIIKTELAAKLEKQVSDSAAATREIMLKLSWTEQRLDAASSRESELKMQIVTERARVNDLLARIPMLA